MALIMALEKRKFSDFSNLEEGIPRSAADVPRDLPHTPPRFPSTLRSASSRSIATASGSVVNNWGLSLARRFGATNFLRPAVRCLSETATKTKLFILRAVPERLAKFLLAPVNIIAVRAGDSNKRRPIEVPSPRRINRDGSVGSPRVISASRASPKTATPTYQAPTTWIAKEPDSEIYIARRRPHKTVSFDLSLNQLLSPAPPQSPDSDADLDEAMRHIDELSMDTPHPVLPSFSTSRSSTTATAAVDEPQTSIVLPAVAGSRHTGTVQRRTSGAYERLRNEMMERERLLQTEILGASEEDEPVNATEGGEEDVFGTVTTSVDRQAEERSWRTRYLQMKQQNDEKAARLAELDTIAKLSGMSIEEVLSLPLHTFKHNVDATSTADVARTADAANDTEDVKEHAPAVKTHIPTVKTNKAPTKETFDNLQTPHPTSYTPKGHPSTAARAIVQPPPAPQTHEDPVATGDKEEEDDEDDRDPWMTLVDEEELAERTATELADLSISVVPPKLIKPLSQEWLAQIETALATRPPTKKLVSERSDVTPAALGTLAGSNWLNDAVINEFIQHIVDRQQKGPSQADAAATSRGVDDSAGHPAKADPKAPPQAALQADATKPQTPVVVALNSNWWNTVHNRNYSVDDGLKKVLRWAKRAKIDGAKLLHVSNLYIPINASSHWTLLAISGTDRTIEYLNSLRGCGPSEKQVFDIARRYLALHLGEKGYVAEEWTEVAERSAQQRGGVDCGVFVCFNVLSIARGLEPSVSFGHDDMKDARDTIAATLLNSGFTSNLEWVG